jgi:hypothetical protein
VLARRSKLLVVGEIEEILADDGKIHQITYRVLWRKR